MRKLRVADKAVADDLPTPTPSRTGDSADDEFDYTPIAAAELSTETVTSDMKEDATKDEEKKPSSEQGSTLQFANDGSFLEQMKNQMANNSTTT